MTGREGVKMTKTIDAYVCEIRGNRDGNLCELIRVAATYEEANIISSLTFDAPISEASNFHVGQRISIAVSWDTEGALEL